MNWRFALASIVCAVFAMVALVQCVLLSSRRMPSLLAGLGFLALAVANGTYVTVAARRAGFLDPNSPPPPEPDWLCQD
ncbi:MAG TPA: hypothetical protein VM938_07335 [Acidimicrobiales bacterium]|nr:hypothetical protein [Acidimicrobiales bacterium]